MVAVSSKATDTTNFGTRYAWQLIVANAEAVPVTFSVEIQWLDGKGAVVSTDYDTRLSLGPGMQGAFTGEAMIPTPVVAQVVSVRAKVKPR